MQEGQHRLSSVFRMSYGAVRFLVIGAPVHSQSLVTALRVCLRRSDCFVARDYSQLSEGGRVQQSDSLPGASSASECETLMQHGGSVGC